MNHPFGRLLPVVLLTAAFATATLSSCQDSASSIGLPYFKDTVSYKTDTVTSASSIVTYQPTASSRVLVTSGTYNLNWASPIMLIGRAKQGTEDIESWGVLRFATLGGDTLSKVTSVRLLLHTIAYKYGVDSASGNVDLQVYAQEGGGTITDSSVAINPAELTTTPVASITGALADSTGTLVALPIAASEIPKLSATSFAFVIEPGPGMNHVRGFATSETGSNPPVIEYTVQTDTGVAALTRGARLDMHVVRDQSQTPSGEFELRGSLGKRERIDFDLPKLRDSIELTQFTTINSAIIELHADLANTRWSNLVFDTSGPTVVRLTGDADSATTVYGIMTRDAANPEIFRITCGNLIQLWLHDSSTYHPLHLRAGWANRSFGGNFAGVEDNTLNRLTFYGPEATDPTKRPKFYISHSTLK